MSSTWLVRVLALVALSLAIYLAWSSLHERLPIGCGRGGGCERVLESRWSSWFGLPVGLPAASLFATLLATSLVAGDRMPTRLRDRARIALWVLTSLAAAAAIWFIALQLLVLGAVCRVCMATHLCVLAMCIAQALSGWIRVGRLVRYGLLGLLGLPILLVGQWQTATPSSYRLTRSVARSGGEPVTMTIRGLSSDRAGNARPLLAGQLEVDVEGLPHRGRASAPIVVAQVYDYACPHCRRMHHVLARWQRNRPDVVVVSLPVPLDTSCNPFVEADEQTDPDACQLARLAIAVWSVDRRAFAALDDWMFSAEEPPTAEQAYERAIAEIGRERLDDALRSDVADRLLAETTEFYGTLDDGILPMILFSESSLSGIVADEEAFAALADRETGGATGSPGIELGKQETK